MCALPRFRVPGVPDLDAVYGRYDVVIARRTDDLAGRQFTHDPWPHVSRLLPVERGGDIGVDLVRFRNGGEPQFPEASVGGRRAQRLCMARLKRFEPDAVTFECHRSKVDHGTRREMGEGSSEINCTRINWNWSDRASQWILSLSLRSISQVSHLPSHVRLETLEGTIDETPTRATRLRSARASGACPGDHRSVSAAPRFGRSDPRKFSR